MKTLQKVVQEFLKTKTVAVVGVSSKGDTAANIIYNKFKEMDYNVFAVNPNTNIAEGDICYPSLSSIPVKIESVIIGTHPDITPKIVDECIELGIKQVWIHKSIGQGSYNEVAIHKAIQAGISFIPGSCPMRGLCKTFSVILNSILQRSPWDRISVF